jgi:PadR family transcriptional regulator AphA
MPASGVTYVILGALSLGPRSGYEIKQLVDRSTRFFWAASYGQIYPELRRLEADGLISGASEPRGERRRIVYQLTPDGREALRDWLLDPESLIEIRDEGLLKLFFADVLEPSEALALLHSLRARREAALARLREVERQGKALGFPALVLEFGIGLQEWMVEWCSAAERRLEQKRDAEEVAS